MTIKPNLHKPLAIVAMCVASFAAQAANVKVTLNNLAPTGGVGIAPLWVGFHNGGFETFYSGQAASAAIERSAEDGNASVLSANFAASTPTGVQGVLNGGPAFPGAARSLTLSNVDLNGAGRYFSYAGMVVLSNDFFIGNENAKEHDLSSIAKGGKISFLVGGAGSVYDAGTEVNDFNYSLANGAFGIGGGQTGPNQGMDEHGVIHLVTGNPYTSFLGQDLVPQNRQWGALDFNAAPAFARIDIEVSAVPEPETYAMLLAGLGLMGGVARRRKQVSV